MGVDNETVRCEGGRNQPVYLDMRMAPGLYNSGVYCVDVVHRFAYELEHYWLVVRQLSNHFERHKQLDAFERIGIGRFNPRAWRDDGLFMETMSSCVTEILIL